MSVTREINARQLQKILGISRPTYIRWLRVGIIPQPDERRFVPPGCVYSIWTDIDRLYESISQYRPEAAKKLKESA